ncbi:MAG: glycosyltransferase family 2 protein [Hyphomicrobiaceae bacterium]
MHSNADIDVSFIVAAYNAGAFIERTVRSALQQKDASVEVIVVDDHSVDDTEEKMRSLCKSSPNVRYVRLSENKGPSAARNAAIDVATGRWIAALDADDLILPHRSRMLIELAERRQAEIVADNLLSFRDDQLDHIWPHLPIGEEDVVVTLSDWVAKNMMIGGSAALGYLQPMIRRNWLVQRGIYYSERQRLGEDYLLMLHALRHGAKLAITTEPAYLYRVHAGSISQAWGEGQLQYLRDTQREILNGFDVAPHQDLPKILARHEANIQVAIDYETMKRSLRDRRWGDVPGFIASRPALMLAIVHLAKAKIKKLATPRSRAKNGAVAAGKSFLWEMDNRGAGDSSAP